MNSVSSVLKKDWEPHPSPPPEGGRGWRDGKPLPDPPQGAGEADAVGARRVTEFKRLVLWVCSFRVICCRDAASALSKCAGWYSVKSVSSVLKKDWGAPPRPSPVGRERLARW